MKIKRLYIQAFGKHEDLELTPSDGLTVIYGSNESGKTTIVRFILAMLYGFVKGLSRSDIEKNDRMRYLPWHAPGKYGGLLEVEHRGRRYQIQRHFGDRPAGDSLSVVDLGSGEELALTGDQQPGERLLGMGRDEFMSTVFIEQMGSPLETGKGANAELSKRLMSLASGGTDAAPRDVRELLETRRKALQPLRGDNGEIPRLEARCESLEEERNDALAMAEQRARTEAELEAAREEEAELEAERASLRRDEIRAERQRHVVRYRKVQALQDEIRAQREALDADRARLALPEGAPLPARREVSAAYTTAGEIPRAAETLRELRAEAASVEEKLARYPSEDELTAAVAAADHHAEALAAYREEQTELDRALQASRQAYEEERHAKERELRDATIARQKREAEETARDGAREDALRREAEELAEAKKKRREAQQARDRQMTERERTLRERTAKREEAETLCKREQQRLDAQRNEEKERRHSVRERRAALGATRREREEAEARRDAEQRRIYAQVRAAEEHLEDVRSRPVTAADAEEATERDGFTGRPAAHWTLVASALVLILLMIVLPDVWPRVIGGVAVVLLTALLYRRFSRYEGNLEAQSGRAGQLSLQERREWDALRAREEAERRAELLWDEAAKPLEAELRAVTEKMERLEADIRRTEAGLPDLEALIREQSERVAEAKQEAEQALGGERVARRELEALHKEAAEAREADRAYEAALTGREHKLREQKERLAADREAAAKRREKEEAEAKEDAKRLEAMRYERPDALREREEALAQSKAELLASAKARGVARLTGGTGSEEIPATEGAEHRKDAQATEDAQSTEDAQKTEDDAAAILLDETAIRKRRDERTADLHTVRGLRKDQKRLAGEIAETEARQEALGKAWRELLRGVPADIFGRLAADAPTDEEPATDNPVTDAPTDTPAALRPDTARRYTEAVECYEKLLDRVRETERLQASARKRLEEWLGDATEDELREAAETAQAAEAAETAQAAETAEQSRQAQPAQADPAGSGGPVTDGSNVPIPEGSNAATPDTASALDPDSLRERRETLNRRMEDVKQTIGTLRHRLRSEMDAARVPQAIEEDLAACRQELQSAREKLANYDLAIGLVDEGVKRMRETFGPTIDKRASDYLSILTGEAQDLMVKGDFSMRLRDPVSGAFKDHHYFSGGKIDQIYLALRLAVIDTVYEQDGTSLPRFIDDPFMQYDRDRGRAAMTLMQKLAEDGKQVIFTTCHAFYREVAEEEGVTIREL